MIDLNFAIIGAGSIGRRHLRNLQRLGYKNLFAYDPSYEACAWIKRELNIVCCATLDELWLQAPDVVFVTTPSHMHVDIAIEAARRGCHLFVEKPLSYSLEGIDVLCREVEQRNLISLVGCNMRFHFGPAMVKRLIEQGAIGRVIATRIQTGSFLPRWRSQQDYHQSYSASTEWGGAILDCIHEIDLALWYCGPAQIVSAVHLSAESIDLDTDGLAEILLRHASGVLTNVHLNFIQRDYRRTCQIIGSEGTIYWDFSDHQVKLFGSDGQLAQVFPEPDGWDINQMYVEEIKYFFQSIQRQEPTFNSIPDSLPALQIALAARCDKNRIGHS